MELQGRHPELDRARRVVLPDQHERGNRRAGALAAIVVLPLVAHSLEFVVHWWRGTAVLGPSILASVVFTILSTTFNLFAMRRGALIVGHECRSLLVDLAVMPRLVVLFVMTAALHVTNSYRRLLASGARRHAGSRSRRAPAV